MSALLVTVCITFKKLQFINYICTQVKGVSVNSAATTAQFVIDFDNDYCNTLRVQSSSNIKLFAKWNMTLNFAALVQK